MLLVLAALQSALPAPAAPPAYWQQRVSYDIQVSLDEPAGLLRGTQRVIYRNNAPDTLASVSFHLYLNAFRPGSRWADADSVEGRRRFNDLRDPDYGFNRVTDVEIDGRPVEALYPFAPDSTIVRFRLPERLAPSDSIEIRMRFEARPSTRPRRQGRQGRAFDFAQWYPRVVVYDRLGWQEHPLYPAGEFYGEFGDFTVRLDVPDDQVVGATGVPVCGDPGWERANHQPGRPIDYQRTYYASHAASLAPTACDSLGADRKTILWRAEDVHHFALSMRPDYRYEGTKWGDVAVHVLYQPGDEASWGGGVATGRTVTALEWLDGLFGAYPWPQITNLHRIEGGGTEFPMVIMNGSANLGLILHELGHNYLMGVLANNEWREGWLDEGFTSFQTAWFFETASGGGGPARREAIYRPGERLILDWDLDGRSEPTSLAGESYRDFVTYGTMIYTRGALFFQQLRHIVGDDVMRRIIRTYYAKWRLRHVDEAAFRTVAEAVSGRDLSTVFGQWLHGSVLYDYAVGRVRLREEAGRWLARVEVVRREDGMIPVDVVVRSDRDTATVRVEGLAEREWVEVRIDGKPREVILDPEARTHDWNMLNNRKTRGWLGWSGSKARPADFYLDRVLATRSHRDRRATAVMPTAWYNAAGGVMLGARLRSNYLGRFDRTLVELSVATRRCCGEDERTGHWYARLENPTWLRFPRTDVGAEAFAVEGRVGAGVWFEHRRLGHLTFGPSVAFGGSLRWVATDDTSFVDPLQYDDAGTVEAEGYVRRTDRFGVWAVDTRLALGAGVEYRNRGGGTAAPNRYDVQPYGRASIEAVAVRPVGAAARLAIRVFGGAVAGDRDPVRQRWFGVSGAGPYAKLRNPFLRSRDALLTNEVRFHQAGDGNVRGLDPTLLVTRLLAGSIEIDRRVMSRPEWSLAREVSVSGFGDVAWTDGFFSTRSTSSIASDVGIGLRVRHRIGETAFTTRLDIPFLVSHPDRAVGATTKRLGLRWVIGVGGHGSR